jgi:hypothetical protein
MKHHLNFRGQLVSRRDNFAVRRRERVFDIQPGLEYRSKTANAIE